MNLDDVETLLSRLKFANAVDQRDYARVSENLSEGDLKDFFLDQEVLKGRFNQTINAEMEKLDLHESNTDDPLKDESRHGSWPLAKDISGKSLLEWSQHREGKALLFYEELLSHINRGEIREMLLSQKNEVRMAIEKLEALAEAGS
ncbi:hypothetical protein [Christiangramia fulva]|nr:hypothetical protein [Christiangramia fulva]